MSLRRNASMFFNSYRAKTFDIDDDDDEDDDEEECYDISPYSNKSFRNNEIVNYNGGGFPKNFFDMMENNGYNLDLSQSRIKHPDGRLEIQSKIGFSKHKPRKIVNTYQEKKTEVKKDYDKKTYTNSFKTGLIFKKRHYYETQKVIPKQIYENYQRTVTQYDDGSVNYGDWRRIY